MGIGTIVKILDSMDKSVACRITYAPTCSYTGIALGFHYLMWPPMCDVVTDVFVEKMCVKFHI